MSASVAPTYFISDLHLEASRSHITEAFQNFITQTAQGARAIYILGDFVDAWIGDDDNSTFVKKIKTLLTECVATGTNVYFVHGNRDFLIGEQFARDTGVSLLPENTVIDLYGESILILHGDSLCTSDIAYQQFRRKVRNPAWQKKMLGYPLFVRRLIAAYMRFRSRRANHNKSVNIMDVASETVDKTFEEFQIRKMIHGHTHRPDRHICTVQGDTCERIVLGDWETFGWYLKADDTGQELVQFPITTPE